MQLFVGILFLGSPVGLSQFFVCALCGGDRRNVLLISHGILFLFRVGLTQLFVGVRLSEFPFGLQRTVFCLGGGDRGNIFC